MANLNYAESYKQALAQAYPFVLNFGKLFTSPNNATYKTVDAKTIKIPVLEVGGRVDGSRDTIGAFTRNFDNSWETKTLSNHREWSTLVHPMDVNQTNMVATLSNITKVMNEEKKFPEKDAYLISKLYADWAAQSKTANTTALTADNVLTVFDTFMEAMDEARVPANGRLLYLTPAVNTLIKNAKHIVRRLDATGDTLSRKVSRIDEVEIIPVPSVLMRTVYNFTSGYAVGTNASQVNMFLVHPSAVLTPESYSFCGFDEPSSKTKGKYLYFEESFEDVFVLDKRIDALQFNITEPTSSGGSEGGI